MSLSLLTVRFNQCFGLYGAQCHVLWCCLGLIQLGSACCVTGDIMRCWYIAAVVLCAAATGKMLAACFPLVKLALAREPLAATTL